MTIGDIEKIYLENRQCMFRTAYQILKNEQSAEDVVHNVIAKMLMRFEKLNFPNEKAAKVYAIHAAINTAKDELRAKARANTVSLDETTEVPAPDNLLDLLVGAELETAIGAALKQLGDKAASVLSLKQMGVGDQAIASALGISVSDVRVSAFRGRRKLISILQKEGLLYAARY